MSGPGRGARGSDRIAGTAIVFDAFGTLFDTASLVPRLEARFPGEGDRISTTWRATQLRYTWLRSLMGTYEPFDRVTRDALAVALAAAHHEAPEALLDALADGYVELEAYPEAGSVLERLSAAGHRLAILSNGTAGMLGRLVRRAGWEERFEAIMSVDEIGAYKPDPRVYGLVERHLGVAPAATTFVSGNSWDCAGASRCGLDVTWIRRRNEPPDVLGAPAVRVGKDLTILLAESTGP